MLAGMTLACNFMLLFNHLFSAVQRQEGHISDLPTIINCDNVEIKYVHVGFLMLESSLQFTSEA